MPGNVVAADTPVVICHVFFPLIIVVREGVQTAALFAPIRRAWWKIIPFSASESMLGVSIA